MQNLLLLTVLPMACAGFSSEQAPAPAITQVHKGIVAPNYYDGSEWALSPDGSALALPYRSAPRKNQPGRGAGKQGVELWDLTSGKPRMLSDPANDTPGPHSVAFAQQGRALAAADRRGMLIWPLPHGNAPIRIPQTGGVLRMTFDDSDRVVVSQVLGRNDMPDRPEFYKYTIIRFDISARRQLSRFDFSADQSLPAVSPSGSYAVVDDSQDQSAAIYALAPRAKLADLVRYSSFIFSHDSAKLIYLERLTNRLSVLAVPSGKELKRLDVVPPSQMDEDRKLSIDSKADILAVGAYPNSHQASLVSLETGKVLGTVDCGPRLSICDRLQISADGRTLVTSTYPVNVHDRPILPWLKIWRLPEKW